MAYGIGPHTIATNPGFHDVTTTGIDTTGMSLMFVAEANYTSASAYSLSDSFGNTYALLDTVEDSFFGVSLLITYYTQNPTVGASHTVTLSGGDNAPCLAVVTASGALLASPLDQHNSQDTGSTTAIDTGSVTPSEDNELILVAVNPGYNGPLNEATAIDSGFTLLDHMPFTGSEWGLSTACKIQTAAGAENPTFTLFNGANPMAAIATFKAAATGNRRRRVLLTGAA